jgi:4-aminobutyrate aminotransferase-like enzyme/Ser/Thr protein kinase RdoA (MazF antagonist)
VSLVDVRLAPPQFTDHDAVALLADHFGLVGALAPLPSERDQNYHVTTPAGQQFVLKIAAIDEDRRTLECQSAVLARLAAAETPFAFPTLVPDRGGRPIAEVEGPGGGTHMVRVLRFVPGEALANVRVHSPALLEEVGTLMGTMAEVLDGFAPPCADRTLRWDLRVGRQVVDQCLFGITRHDQRSRIERFAETFDRIAAPLLPRLRTNVVHNDANDHNVLVSHAVPEHPLRPRRVTGIVDFGDLVDSFVVGEVAIAAAYVMLRKRDPLLAASYVVRGFHAKHALTDDELAALFPLIWLRLCTSAVLSAHQRALQPGNAYLSVSETAVWTLLGRLEAVDPEFAQYRFREACGRVPCPRGEVLASWLKAEAEHIGPILEPDPRGVARLTLDLSVASAEWNTLAADADAAAWSAAIASRMHADGATIAIGRYDEARLWYTAPQFRTQTDAGDEWRTIHLGVDLFAPVGTPVLAPVDGTVVSVRNNSGRLDYGPTVILRHRIPGVDASWYTLYGHLDESALSLRPGQRMTRGDRIAGVGAIHVNGGWAPHLHFQIIADLVGNAGDFPGVARPSERAVWLSISPDPNLILRFPEGCRAVEKAASRRLLEARRERLGPSLSLAYRSPLTIVRGRMQHLYDVDGRRYLDVVNNVAHVGHCHPHVVSALQRQSAVLNTNTRYLHPAITRYAERLTAHLPARLRVCYFVCSGSEANELALRLALAHTRQRDVVVIDHAYHGNTTSLVELSPYKFDGPGGNGAPPHVHKVSLPDPYRGRNRGYGEDAGRRYAAEVGDVAAAIRQSGRGVAAFFAEALISGGGQIEPPQGYLAECYRHVRERGGVCIADEVQIGFGRMGTHFWGFETQGVVPDIVTMGKPIGNGHPLGAVVTTPEIAASFTNGMEYFNTFGGNPVSCEVGLAVLDVIEQEELQGHAHRVGGHLRHGLRSLMERHPLIGDVRGRGLFLDRKSVV